MIDRLLNVGRCDHPAMGGRKVQVGKIPRLSASDRGYDQGQLIEHGGSSAGRRRRASNPPGR